MDVLKKHVDMLGFRVKDKISGFEGVASSICFDLYGCIQLAISPPSKDGEMKDSRWFDVNRLEFMSTKRVMDVPSFSHLADSEGVHQKGPAEKPAR